MGRISRALTRTAEAVHNVTSEPIADGAKFLGSKVAQAKDAIATEHEVQEALRQERKAKREQEKAEERAKVEAEKANADALSSVIASATDPASAAEFFQQMADLARTQVKAVEEKAPKPAPMGRVRKAQATKANA